MNNTKKFQHFFLFIIFLFFSFSVKSTEENKIIVFENLQEIEKKLSDLECCFPKKFVINNINVVSDISYSMDEFWYILDASPGDVVSVEKLKLFFCDCIKKVDTKK